MKFDLLEKMKGRLIVNFITLIFVSLVISLTSLFVFSGIDGAGGKVFIIVSVMLIGLIVSGIISFVSIRNVTNLVARLNQATDDIIVGGNLASNVSAETSEQFEAYTSIINDLVKDTKILYEEHSRGNSSFCAESRKYTGAYSEIIDTVNKLAKFYGDLTTKANTSVNELLNGNLSVKPEKEEDYAIFKGLSALGEKLALIKNYISNAKDIIAIGRFDEAEMKKLCPGELQSIPENLKYISAKVNSKFVWYESMLDSIPFPISVTDVNMNWTFINKPVEGMLGIKRKEVIGKHCSNWGADICKTSNCGIDCLRHGKEITYFTQQGMDFQVNLNYLYDEHNNKVGHIEVVQDISKLRSMEAKKHFITKIKDSCDAFISVSSSLADSSQSMASSTTTQSRFMEKLSSSFELLINKSRSTSEMAKTASGVTAEIKERAQLGDTQMSSMLQSVNDMSEANRAINKIIKNIEDIAFQTNILALNASVEAARAGQAGKGFAVVAEEVRNLAEKSAQAAKDSNILISNSLSKADISEKIVHSTSESFGTIVNGIADCDVSTHAIFNASIEQIKIIEVLNKEIEEIVNSVVQNSAVAEESASASEELASQATMLQALVAQFVKESMSI